MARIIPRQAPKSVALSFLAVVLGILGAYGAVAFRWLYDRLTLLLYGADPADVGGTAAMIWLPLGGAAVGLILLLSRQKRWTSVDDLIIATNFHEGRLSLREGWLSSLTAMLSLGVGASVGRYGPAVVLGATLSATVGRIFRVSRSSRMIMIGCGVAAAIAAAFDAPIAGVIFAHEAILGHYALRAFAPITVASVVSAAVSRGQGFDYLVLQVGEGADFTPSDLPEFALIGLMAAGVSILLMQVTLWVAAGAQRLQLPVWLQPLLASVLVATLGVFCPAVLGLGDTTIQKVLAQGTDAPVFPAAMLLTLVAAKLLATALCLGGRFPGGIFGPALFLGAALGGAFGMALDTEIYQICVLVGMGAVISSVVGAPIATILIVFELTRNYDAAIAVMIGVVVANAVVNRYYARSFFHRVIRLRGFDIDLGREHLILEGRVIEDLAGDKFIKVGGETTVDELGQVFRLDPDSDAYVVNEDGTLDSRVEPVDLIEQDADRRACTVGRKPSLVFYRGQNVRECLHAVEDFPRRSVPVVVSEQDPTLVGVVRIADLVQAYRDAVRTARNEERGGDSE